MTVSKKSTDYSKTALSKKSIGKKVRNVKNRGDKSKKILNFFFSLNTMKKTF